MRYGYTIVYVADVAATLDFYERGILSLPDRWRQVIDTDGAYIDQN